MKTIIFGGITVNEQDVKEILADAILLPPAKHADVISAVQNYNPDVIGIIDGVIHSELSVWHKEILFALDNGIRVYGAGGMGAIRAAELYSFGMNGYGKVFADYKDGKIEDDDEVFVKYDLRNGRYESLSMPMVNIRATLNAALYRNIIDSPTYALMTHIGKSLHYTERTLGEVCRLGVEQGIDENIMESLKCLSEENQFNLTRQDALGMLREISRIGPADLDINKKDPPEYSMLFAPLYERERMVRQDNLELPLYYIGNYLCLFHPGAEDLNYHGLNRELALYLAQILQIEVEENDIETEITRFRRKHHLEDDNAFNRWIRENDLPGKDFKDLFKKQALLRKMHYWFFTSRRQFVKNTSYLLEELKLQNVYVKWKEAASKQEAAACENDPAFRERFVALDFASLFREYIQNRTLPWSIDIKEAAKEMGMRKKDIKIQLVKDLLYREKLVADAVQLMG